MCLLNVRPQNHFYYLLLDGTLPETAYFILNHVAVVPSVDASSEHLDAIFTEFRACALRCCRGHTAYTGPCHPDKSRQGGHRPVFAGNAPSRVASTLGHLCHRWCQGSYAHRQLT
eukprot:6209987-Pleurochrysis_carterae.AAC.1